MLTYEVMLIEGMQFITAQSFQISMLGDITFLGDKGEFLCVFNHEHWRWVKAPMEELEDDE